MNKLTRSKRYMTCILTIYIITSGLLLVSCSKSSSSNDPGTNSITGVASKGLLTNASINVYALDTAGNKGSLLETATTDTIGAYNVNIGTYTGNVLVEATGGTYIDEATGSSTANTATLRTAVENASGSVKAAVTPLTEIAVRKAGTLTTANINSANAVVSNMIGGTNIITTMPANILVSSSSTTDENNYGLMLAAISQMVSLGSVTSVSGAINAITADLMDNNTLDSTGASIASALSTFISSGNNHTNMTTSTTPAVQGINSGITAGIYGWTGFIDLSHENYSLPSGLTWDGQNIWVSNYVSGGSGGGQRIIYKYDITTGLSVGSIPSPSDWTGSLGFDGSAICLIDYADGVQLFRISKDTGSIISKFPVVYSGSYWGLAWDGHYFYLADYNLESGPVTRIYKYDPLSGTNLGVIYSHTGSISSSGQIYSVIRGVTYKDFSLWVLTAPDVAGGPYKIINISLAGQELSTMNVPDSSNSYLQSLAYIEGAFWSINNTKLVRFIP